MSLAGICLIADPEKYGLGITIANIGASYVLQPSLPWRGILSYQRLRKGIIYKKR